jgi:hypothetical protein
MNTQQKKRNVGIGLFIAAIAVFVVLVGSEFIGGQTFGEAEGDLVGGAVPNEASQDAVNVEVRFPPSGFLSSPRTETWSRNGDQWTFLHSTGSRPSGDLALPRRSSTDISQHLSGATWAQEAGSDRVYLTPTSGRTNRGAYTNICSSSADW